MKILRWTSMILAFMLAFGIFALAPQTAYADEISVSFEGIPVNFPDASPQIVDGRTLVPVRAVFEARGFDVGWELDTRTVTLTRSDYTVAIAIGSADFTANGHGYTLDVPAQIIDGSTMLPIRAVLESVGYLVFWDEEFQEVWIGRDRERILDNLPGTWVISESNMPWEYLSDFLTLDISGSGETGEGEHQQNLSWLVNAYNNLVILYPDDRLVYFVIRKITSTTLKLETGWPEPGLPGVIATLTR